MKILPLTAALALLLAACASPEFLGTPMQEERYITSAPDSSRTITLKKAMVFYDSAMEISQGLMLPDGDYTMCGYDAHYEYFESTYMLERRKIHDMQVRDQWLFKGGIAFAKNPNNPVRAAAYVSGSEPGQKGLTWALGTSFFKKENKEWKKNF